MKTRSKRSFFSGGKLLLLLLVVLASALFIWQYVFVRNTTKSSAHETGMCCRSSSDCPSDNFCMKLSNSQWDACPYGSCEPRELKGMKRTGAVNFRCSCTAEFGPCEDKWGQTNIKSRSCDLDLRGSEKCNYREGSTLYQWVSCAN